MTTQLSDAEMDALLDASQAAKSIGADVRTRDFAKPRRFSDERLEEIARSVRRALPEASERLTARIRGDHRMTLAALVEERADVIVSGSTFTVPILAFDCGAETGLVLWDVPAAVAACELALGAGAGAAVVERKLTSCEEALLVEIVKPMLASLATAVGFEAKGLRAARNADAFTPFDANGGDPLRLGVQVAIEGSAGASTLRVYAPVTRLDTGTPQARAKAAAPRSSAPPAHLNAIAIEIAAEIGALEISLRDVLALEVGDVLSLPTLAGGPATLVADGRAIATARFGEENGKLAICVQSPLRTAANAGRTTP